MQIIVASGNIFRRELSSYVLSEQGYRVGEAKHLDVLLGLVAAAAPLLLVLDSQLSPAGPADLLRRVRAQCPAPILLIGGPSAPSYDLPPAIEGRTATLPWPYHPADLLRCIAELLDPAIAAARPSEPLAQRYIGAGT